MDPKNLRFTKTHEWISPDGTVGISDHAQKEVTDVVFVELPAVGQALKKEQEAGTIESVKAAFPIYAPVSGKISAVNQSVGNNPALVNQSPYGDGWIYKIEPADSAELNALMTHEQYEQFLKQESHH